MFRKASKQRNWQREPLTRITVKRVKQTAKKEAKGTYSYRQSKGLRSPICRHGYHRRTEESTEDAKERQNNSKNMYLSKVPKDEEDRVPVEDLKILERWREYYQKLTDEESPREGRNEQQAEVEAG